MSAPRSPTTKCLLELERLRERLMAVTPQSRDQEVMLVLHRLDQMRLTADLLVASGMFETIRYYVIYPVQHLAAYAKQILTRWEKTLRAAGFSPHTRRRSKTTTPYARPKLPC